jgi:hypothetical protein
MIMSLILLVLGLMSLILGCISRRLVKIRVIIRERVIAANMVV